MSLIDECHWSLDIYPEYVYTAITLRDRQDVGSMLIFFKYQDKRKIMRKNSLSNIS